MVAWQEIREPVDRWLADGRRVAIATVLETWGSAPRPAGAALAVSEDGSFAGSVTAGCVEGALVGEAAQVLSGGSPKRLRYGVGDDRAWSLGLACGGTVDLWLDALDEGLWRAAWAALDARRPAVWATVVGGPGAWLGRACLVEERGAPAAALAGSAGLAVALGDALGGAGLTGGALADRVSGEPRLQVLPVQGASLECFLHPLRPARRLVVVGATHIAQALVRLAKVLDLETVVVDPRAAFATAERFPAVDGLHVAWPASVLERLGLDATTAVAVLSHDPKLDDPALALALRSPAGYVGALGSRKSQAERRERLAAAGLAEAEIARLRGPIGLDIGARTPAEIALAILAQVVAEMHRKGEQ